MRYTIIGLGQFGQDLCHELSHRNMDIVAVGNTDESLEDVKDDVTYTVVVDYTNPIALRELELDESSSVIVTIGDSFEQNLLVVSHLQKMGVKRIYARVMNSVHGYILRQMNVFKLINLSQVASRQLASQLESPEFIRTIPLDENHLIAEIALPSFWVDKKLRDVELRTKHHLNLLTVRRGDSVTEQESKEFLAISPNPVLDTPDPDLVFETQDVLVLFGREDALLSFGNFSKGKH
ncbi:MAG: TrkA family potassium uptake protein [Akkermansia sp.]